MNDIFERIKNRLQLLAVQLICFLNSKSGRKFIRRTFGGVAAVVIADIVCATFWYAPVMLDSIFTGEATSLGLAQVLAQYGFSMKTFVGILQKVEFFIHGWAFIKWLIR